MFSQIVIGGIMRAFFAAMQNGYAQEKVKKQGLFIGSAEAAMVPGPTFLLPGSKAITHQHGDYFILDGYYVQGAAGDYSCGQTVIWYNEKGVLVPMWVMSYRGWYKKGVIPFLKHVLKETYDQNFFHGGRGPRCFTDKAFEGLTYVNNAQGDWRKFDGNEFILNADNVLEGEHEYHGGIMA